jgi:hypothetical protein
MHKVQQKQSRVPIYTTCKGDDIYLEEDDDCDGGQLWGMRLGSDPPQKRQHAAVSHKSLIWRIYRTQFRERCWKCSKVVQDKKSVLKGYGDALADGLQN